MPRVRQQVDQEAQAPDGPLRDGRILQRERDGLPRAVFEPVRAHLHAVADVVEPRDGGGNGTDDARARR